MEEMEDQWNSASILSLKELSLKRMAVNLCNEPDILNSIVRFFTLFPNRYTKKYIGHSFQTLYTMSFDYLENWREHVESEVTDKITKLVIPKTLANQLLLIVLPVGLHIIRWKGFHEYYLRRPDWKPILKKHFMESDVELNMTILSKLCWTAGGNVDYRKTAEKLIKCKILDVVKRYILACMYCLDDLIPVLWTEIPEKLQQKFYNISKVLGKETIQLEFCWPYILKGEQYRLNDSSKRYRNFLSFNQYAFADSARHGNKAAAEYFYQKLAPNEKQYSFISTTALDLLVATGRKFYNTLRIFPLENMSDSFFYLFSLMNFDEQMNFVKQYYSFILSYFIELPWNEILLKLADYIWPLIPNNGYDSLLLGIEQNFSESHYCFPKFFQEIFIRCPHNLRKKFVDWERRKCVMFHRFLYFQDSETIQVILGNLDITDRYKLVSCKKVFELFCDCFLNMKLDTLKICLQETILSKKDKERLKRAFLGFLTKTGRVQIQESKLVQERFLELLNEVCPSAKRKRSLKNKTQKKAKKICFNK